MADPNPVGTQVENLLRDSFEDLYSVVRPTAEERNRLNEGAVGFALATAMGNRKEAKAFADAINLTVGALQLRAARASEEAAFKLFTRLLGLALALV